jgi:hypothetical protein
MRTHVMALRAALTAHYAAAVPRLRFLRRAA